MNTNKTMSMPIIRKAILKDAPVITGFQVNMAWETEKLALAGETVTSGVNAVFQNPALGQYWVAEEEGDVVASLLITFEWSDWRNSWVWWIQSVYVMSEHRRKGIFRTMYSHIRSEAEKLGIPGLRLYVERNNASAIKTYESLGMNREHYTLFEWMKE